MLHKVYRYRHYRKLVIFHSELFFPEGFFCLFLTLLCLITALWQVTIDKINRDNSGIDNQKQALYGTWLQLNPGATWGNVIHALETVGENRLAESIKKIDWQEISVQKMIVRV